MSAIGNTGFAEFAASLLSEVLDGVVAAQLEQERKLAELRTAAALDLERFAAAYVDAAEVAAAQAADPGQASADEVRVALARDKQQLLQAMLARGLPRVLVDHGRVNAKITLSLDEGTASPAAATRASALPTGLATRRLRVAPVHVRGPEFLRLKADITSEIDITFKTVTD